MRDESRVGFLCPLRHVFDASGQALHAQLVDLAMAFNLWERLREAG